MELRKKFTSVLAASAVLVGMTAGVALADDDSLAETELLVTCTEVGTIDVDVDGQFEVDISDNLGGYSADLNGGFTVVLDLTCNWSRDFQVNAEIGTFWHEDGLLVTPIGSTPFFGGEKLTLDNPDVDYDGIWSILNRAGQPEVASVVFPGGSSSSVVIENDEWTVLFWTFDVASPGVTTVVYDGHLTGLPDNLAPGVYSGDLTMELVVN